MKKLFLVVLLAMVSTVTFAQISWNVQAGVNMSNLSNIEDSKMKFGYQVGVGMEYAIDDMWSIRPSLQFITKGAKADYSEGGASVESSMNPMYLQLPVMAAAGFNISDNMKVVVKAGPYFAFGIGGKSKDSYSYEGVSQEEEYDIFGDDGAKRFDFGLGVGAALEFGKMFVGLDGLFGLTKMYDGDGAPKNTTIALSVGYKF